MLGLNVTKELDFSQKPFGLVVRVEDTDGSFTEATLHLMVSAAHVTVDLPAWAKATDCKMFCWRQTEPAALAPSSTPGFGFLLQFSLTTKRPLFTLYFVRGNQRKVICATSTFRFKCGVAQFDIAYTQLKVSVRQAFAEEVLFGYAKVALPNPLADSRAIVATIDKVPDSLLETHVDAPVDSEN